MRVAVFPYSNQFETMIRHDNLFQTVLVSYLLAPSGYGLNGKHIEGSNRNYTVQNELSMQDIEAVDALLLVETKTEIPFQMFLTHIETFLQKKKNIILARKFEQKEYEIILELCHKNHSELILLENLYENKYKAQPSSFIELQEIQTPVVIVAGNGEQCGKYELQLELRERMQKEGYLVCSVGSRQYSEISGIHSCPSFLFDSGLREEEKIFHYNQYIKYLEDEENPDIIIIGVPGGFMPITKKKTAHFGIAAFEIFHAVTPDFVVLALHNDNYKNSYFDEMKKLLFYRFNIEPDCFFISNFSYDRFTINSEMPIKYIEYQDKEIQKRVKAYANNVFCRSDYAEMTEYLLSTLAGYEDIKVL